MLEDFTMEECKVAKTPGDTSNKLSKEMCPSNSEEIQEMKDIPYREAVGSLNFAAVTCRPDISFAVGQVSQYLNNPGKPYWTAVKRILRYLKGTKQEGITLGFKPSPLTGFCDSDYAGNTDNRKSTSGFLFTFFGGVIAWASRTQKVTALSSTEAEYISIADGIKDTLWTKRLISDLGYKTEEPVIIYNDNISAQKLLRNPQSHGRAKHIDVKYHFIREKQEKNAVLMSN
jgi:hypothetical protein